MSKKRNASVVRRPLLGQRRGRPAKGNKHQSTARKVASAPNLHRLSRLKVLQFNPNSIPAHLDEFRSRVYELKPDVVIVQEDRIMTDEVPYKVDGYRWVHRRRTQPRSSTMQPGGGVSILVNTHEHLRFEYETLPPINLHYDTTTEAIRLRLYWMHPGGTSIVDVINVYRPPIHSSPADKRQNLFDISYFLPYIEDLKTHPPSKASSGVLFCGDLNVHSKSWDHQSSPDKLGKAIEGFLNNNNFSIANDGSPTFETNNAKTAIDLTTFSGDIVIENWQTTFPIGNSHHKVLQYDLVAPDAEPLSLHRINTTVDSLLSNNIVWSKVDFSKFNSGVCVQFAFEGNLFHKPKWVRRIKWVAKSITFKHLVHHLYHGFEIVCQIRTLNLFVAQRHLKPAVLEVILTSTQLLAGPSMGVNILNWVIKTECLADDLIDNNHFTNIMRL